MNRFPLPRYLATALLCLAAAFFVSPSAHADTLYTSTGQNFTFASGDYTTSQSVTGYFILADALSPNRNLYDGRVYPVAYSFSDGNQTLTNTNSIANFIYATDASGALTAYNLYIEGPPTSNGHYRAIQVSSGGDYVSDLIGSGSTQASGTLIITPVAPTPEPSTLLLLSTGILGLAGAARRRIFPQA